MCIQAEAAPTSSIFAVDEAHFVSQQHYFSQCAATQFWPQYEYANQWSSGYGLGSPAFNYSYDSGHAATQPNHHSGYLEGYPLVMVPPTLPTDSAALVEEQHNFEGSQFSDSSIPYSQYINLPLLPPVDPGSWFLFETINNNRRHYCCA